MEKPHHLPKENHAAVTSVCSSVLLALFLQAMYGAVDLLIVGKFAFLLMYLRYLPVTDHDHTVYNSPAYKMLFSAFMVHRPISQSHMVFAATAPVSYRKTPVHCTVFSFHVQLHKPSYHFPHGNLRAQEIIFSGYF